MCQSCHLKLLTKGFIGILDLSPSLAALFSCEVYCKLSTMPGTPRENSTAELRSLIARDLAASNDLASRITQLRQDIAAGKPLPTKKIDIMERSNKDTARELMNRIEKIESSTKLDPTDREMLQALNARLSVCDLQTMRLAELRDLEVAARRENSQDGQKPESGNGECVEELPTTAPSALRQRQRQDDNSLAETGHGVSIAHDIDIEPKFERQHSDNEEASQEDDNEDSEADESEWPLLYRILSVDPKTSAGDMSSAVDRYGSPLRN